MKYLWRFALDLNCPPGDYGQLSRDDTEGGIGALQDFEQRGGADKPPTSPYANSS